MIKRPKKKMISQILFLKQVFLKHDIMTFLKPWLVIRHEA